MVLIIRIPRSWRPPHRVTFSDHDKFWTRATNGKHSMDVTELRAAFALAETAAERIRNFRDGRLARIVAAETPVPLCVAPKIVLHIIPVGAFDPAAEVDLALPASDPASLPLLPGRADHWGYNFDGFLAYTKPQTAPTADGYLQLFRNGSMEVVDAHQLRSEKGERKIYWQYEQRLLKAVANYLRLQKDLGVEPPIFLMLSLLGVRGYVMQPRFDDQAKPGEPTPIDGDDLLVADAILESFDSTPAEVLKPVFDAVWNASGYPGSLNYDDDGRWKLGEG